MSEFKKGDVVQLKSGGPEMTIIFIEDDEAACEWFAKDDAKSRRFQLTSLKKVEDLGEEPSIEVW